MVDEHVAPFPSQRFPAKTSGPQYATCFQVVKQERQNTAAGPRLVLIPPRWQLLQIIKFIEDLDSFGCP